MAKPLATLYPASREHPPRVVEASYEDEQLSAGERRETTEGTPHEGEAFRPG